MASAFVTVVLVVICSPSLVQGDVKCIDAMDCSREAAKEDCRSYPAPHHILKNCAKTCGVCTSETNTCSFGYVERQGECESCETAVLAGWDGAGVCTPCPDRNKRGIGCRSSCMEECDKGCNRWTGYCIGCKQDKVTGEDRVGNFCEDKCQGRSKNGACTIK